MEGRGWEGKEGEGREERGMGACTHCDFRKSAPMLPKSRKNTAKQLGCGLSDTLNLRVQPHLAPHITFYAPPMRHKMCCMSNKFYHM